MAPPPQAVVETEGDRGTNPEEIVADVVLLHGTPCHEEELPPATDSSPGARHPPQAAQTRRPGLRLP